MSLSSENSLYWRNKIINEGTRNQAEVGLVAYSFDPSTPLAEEGVDIWEFEYSLDT